jgi:hypothetical protein
MTSGTPRIPSNAFAPALADATGSSVSWVPAVWAVVYLALDLQRDRMSP